MNYWQFSVHAPFNAKESLIEYYRDKVDLNEWQNSSTYAAMVHSLDQAVGALLEELDRLGIADNTAIIFFSDNGGNQHSGVVDKLPSGEEYITTLTNNFPLRGGKATIYEGGVREPDYVTRTTDELEAEFEAWYDSRHGEGAFRKRASAWRKYQPRTWANVRDSDYTIWFGHTTSAGVRATAAYAWPWCRSLP